MLGKFCCRLHVSVNLWHWNMIKLGVKQGKIGYQAFDILQIVMHCLWLMIMFCDPPFPADHIYGFSCWLFIYEMWTTHYAHTDSYSCSWENHEGMLLW